MFMNCEWSVYSCMAFCGLMCVLFSYISSIISMSRMLNIFKCCVLLFPCICDSFMSVLDIFARICFTCFTYALVSRYLLLYSAFMYASWNCLIAVRAVVLSCSSNWFCKARLAICLSVIVSA